MSNRQKADGDERPCLRPVSATHGREPGGRDLLLGEGGQDEVTLGRKGLSDDAMFKQGTTNAKTQNRKKQMPPPTVSEKRGSS